VSVFVRIADSFDQQASSGVRYIVNSPGSTPRVHQHLDIGPGEAEHLDIGPGEAKHLDIGPGEAKHGARRA
jgi:hypothetical protein